MAFLRTVPSVGGALRPSCAGGLESPMADASLRPCLGLSDPHGRGSPLTRLTLPAPFSPFTGLYRPRSCPRLSCFTPRQSLFEFDNLQVPDSQRCIYSSNLFTELRPTGPIASWTLTGASAIPPNPNLSSAFFSLLCNGGAPTPLSSFFASSFMSLYPVEHQDSCC